MTIQISAPRKLGSSRKTVTEEYTTVNITVAYIATDETGKPVNYVEVRADDGTHQVKIKLDRDTMDQLVATWNRR